MAVEVYIPKFGQTVEEVKLLQWLAEDGAAVKKGQEILEIETDKTTFFVEAEGAGTLHRGPYQVDQTIPVLTVVAIIGAADEKFTAEAQVEAEAEAKVEVEAKTEVRLNLSLNLNLKCRRVAPGAQTGRGKGHRPGDGRHRPDRRRGRAHRRARRAGLSRVRAQGNAGRAETGRRSGVDLRAVTGTGPGGKITKEDVEQAGESCGAGCICV